VSVAASLREAVIYSRLSRLQDGGTVEHAILTGFMRKGEFFTATEHALDFALLVAEALCPTLPTADLLRASRYIAAENDDDNWLPWGEWQRLSRVLREVAEAA